MGRGTHAPGIACFSPASLTDQAFRMECLRRLHVDRRFAKLAKPDRPTGRWMQYASCGKPLSLSRSRDRRRRHPCLVRPRRAPSLKKPKPAPLQPYSLCHRHVSPVSCVTSIRSRNETRKFTLLTKNPNKLRNQSSGGWFRLPKHFLHGRGILAPRPVKKGVGLAMSLWTFHPFARKPMFRPEHARKGREKI
jgi:hypothetical protein